MRGGPRSKRESAQIGILFHLFRELIGERGVRRFALHREIARGLIVNRDLHVGIRQALEEMEKHLDRIIMRVDRGRERLPVAPLCS